MREKIFKKGDAYEMQDGDWFEWRHRRYTRKYGLWDAPYVGGGGVDSLNDAQVLDLLNYIPDFEIHREVPDEPYVLTAMVLNYSGGNTPFVESFQVPKGRFADGDRVKVTIEKVSE